MAIDVPAGYAVSRLGDKTTMLLGVGLMAATGLLASQANNAMELGVAAFLFGSAMAGWLIARLTHISEAVPIHHRGKAISTMAGIQRFGNLIGPVASGAIAVNFGFEYVFIGVSKCGILSAHDVKSMASDPIIFAMANPVPEIMPDAAKEAGAFIVGTGRSDFPNQVNNVLAFPGIFRGAIDARAKRISSKMKIEAAYALAASVENLSVDEILPSPLDKSVAKKIARAVQNAYEE